MSLEGQHRDRKSLHTAPFVPAASRSDCQNARIARILRPNKTRQGYARKRILKPAGYFFVRPKSAAHCSLGGAR